MLRTVLVLTTAVAGGLISSSSNSYMNSYERSPLQPPWYMFIVIWVVIYVLYAIVWEYLGLNNYIPQWLDMLFAVNMFLNFLWVYLFFGLGNVLGSQIVIIILLIMTFFQAFAILFFSYVRTQWNGLCSLALFFYGSWLIIATILNFSSKINV